MLILGNDEVRAALEGQEDSVIDAVSTAYRQHALGRTAIPHSVFLRWPGSDRNRIIALPAYLGSDDERGQRLAGVKWVASFPGNYEQGLPRANATVMLNSVRTGRPEAVIEGSLISAQRTAASAALAARVLGGDRADGAASVIGCGAISREIVRFLRVALPGLRTVAVFDVDRDRQQAFAERCADSWPDLTIELLESADDALRQYSLVSIATTATQPHLETAGCGPGTLILHVSLRDLTVGSILSCDNVVDDPDHVCREHTSLHLAEQQAGHRRFIGHTIGELLNGGGDGRRASSKVTVFSPFGLGVLDLAVAHLVRQRAISDGAGIEVANFSP